MQFLIETERLILRNLGAEDVNGMFELNSNAQVQRFVGNQPIKSLAEAKENIEFIQAQYIKNGVGRLAVIDKQTGDFLGWGGLKLITEEMNGQHSFYELGYRLLPKYWGKGFATEVANASIKYGFEELKLDMIYGIADVENHASRNVLEKVGFKFIETFDYQSTPHCWFIMVKNDYSSSSE